MERKSREKTVTNVAERKKEERVQGTLEITSTK